MNLEHTKQKTSQKVVELVSKRPLAIPAVVLSCFLVLIGWFLVCASEGSTMKVKMMGIEFQLEQAVGVVEVLAPDNPVVQYKK